MNVVSPMQLDMFTGETFLPEREDLREIPILLYLYYCYLKLFEIEHYMSFIYYNIVI